MAMQNSDTHIGEKSLSVGRVLQLGVIALALGQLGACATETWSPERGATVREALPNSRAPARYVSPSERIVDPNFDWEAAAAHDEKPHYAAMPTRTAARYVSLSERIVDPDFDWEAAAAHDERPHYAALATVQRESPDERATPEAGVAFDFQKLMACLASRGGPDNQIQGVDGANRSMVSAVAQSDRAGPTGSSRKFSKHFAEVLRTCLFALGIGPKDDRTETEPGMQAVAEPGECQAAGGANLVRVCHTTAPSN